MKWALVALVAWLGFNAAVLAAMWKLAGRRTPPRAPGTPAYMRVPPTTGSDGMSAEETVEMCRYQPWYAE